MKVNKILRVMSKNQFYKKILQKNRILERFWKIVIPLKKINTFQSSSADFIAHFIVFL